MRMDPDGESEDNHSFDFLKNTMMGLDGIYAQEFLRAGGE